MIYDCFTFFNELDLLEIRLNELSGVVDKFVLVEATKTHQGKEKPLHFKENSERFGNFKDKIIHVIVDEYPAFDENSSAWILEHHQRNMIMKGLEGCRPDDVIMISDIDEIPNPQRIAEYKDVSGMKIFRQKMYYYFLNCENARDSAGYDNHTWNGTIVIHYKDIVKPQDLREMSMRLLSLYHHEFFHRIYWTVRFLLSNLNAKHKVVFVNRAGWHFSYLGGIDRIIKKLEAFAHTE